MTKRHVDVLIVAPGCRASVRAITCSRIVPARAMSSWRAARPSAAPGICFVIPASVPTATCSRWATRSSHGPSRRRLRTGGAFLTTSATPPPITASIGISASTIGSAGVVVIAGRALDRGGRTRASGRGRRELALTCNFLFMCSGYYNYEEGYLPDFRAPRILRPHRASAEMARRSRLRRQARRGDRLRRDRGHAGARAGQDCRARDHAAALANLYGRASGEDAFANSCARDCQATRLSSSAGASCCGACSSSSSAGQAGSGEGS